MYARACGTPILGLCCMALPRVTSCRGPAPSLALLLALAVSLTVRGAAAYQVGIYNDDACAAPPAAFLTAFADSCSPNFIHYAWPNAPQRDLLGYYAVAQGGGTSAITVIGFSGTGCTAQKLISFNAEQGSCQSLLAPGGAIYYTTVVDETPFGLITSPSPAVYSRLRF